MYTRAYTHKHMHTHRGQESRRANRIPGNSKIFVVSISSLAMASASQKPALNVSLPCMPELSDTCWKKKKLNLCFKKCWNDQMVGMQEPSCCCAVISDREWLILFRVKPSRHQYLVHWVQGCSNFCFKTANQRSASFAETLCVSWYCNRCLGGERSLIPGQAVSDQVALGCCPPTIPFDPPPAYWAGTWWSGRPHCLDMVIGKTSLSDVTGKTASS